MYKSIVTFFFFGAAWLWDVNVEYSGETEGRCDENKILGKYMWRKKDK